MIRGRARRSRGWPRRHVAFVCIVGLLGPGITGTGAASAAECAGPTTPTVTWDGGAGTNRWEDGANWAPDGEPGRRGEPIDDFVCIPATLAGQPVSVLLGDGVESHLIGIDAEGTLTVADGGKLFLHGPSPSTVTTFVLSAGTLGGEGTVTVTRELDWRAQARPEGASTQTTRPLESIPPESPDAPHEDSPGKTVIASGAVMLIDGPFGHAADPNATDGRFGCGPNAPCGGVNLRDGRMIENHGTTMIAAAGYVAADWGTRFENLGTLDIRNDRGYYEGFLVGGDAPGELVNSGLIEKSATSELDGTGDVSVIDATFSNPAGPSGIAVSAGSLSITTNLGDRETATVNAGGSLQTGGCQDAIPRGEGSCDEPATSSTDRQTTAVTMPQHSETSRVTILEETPPARRRNFRVIGEQATMSVPNATPTRKDPLRVAITIDHSEVDEGRSVVLFSTDGRLPRCGTPEGDTCYSAPQRTPSGDVEISVRTRAHRLTVYPAQRRNF